MGWVAPIGLKTKNSETYLECEQSGNIHFVPVILQSFKSNVSTDIFSDDVFYLFSLSTE